MTKDDLKTGMLVQCRNENIFLLINDTFIGVDGYLTLDSYHHDLTDKTIEFNEDWDIIRVTEVLEKGQLLSKGWEHNMKKHIIWDKDKSIIEPVTDQYLRTEQFDIELDRWVERDQD